MTQSDEDFGVAGDTDSRYVKLKQIVSLLGIENKSQDEITEALDDFIKEVMDPEIQKYTEALQQYLNNPQNKMVWEREAIAPSTIMVSKKRYAMLVKNSEGVHYDEPKMKVVGLESKKSNTPEWARPELENIYEICLNQNQSQYYKYLSEVKKKLYSLTPEQIGIPSGVNNVEKYTQSDGSCKKGTPKHVRAAINHNRLLKERDIKHIEPIKSGSNLKYVELIKPNPSGESVMGFETYLPEEFGLHKYIDYESAYERGFIKPLKNFVDAIKWNTEETVSLF